ncbi:MAG: ABC transporter ATP-binding protein [Deltaproteobacteria bacterium]|jgi:iron complex transport system ATP-binding protein
MITVDGLVVRLGDRDVLDGVSLEVPEGAFVAVVGPNGSGKTTLIRTLYGAIARRAGTVRIDDRPLESYDRRALAQTVAVLRQEGAPEFDFLVRELVMMGRSPYKRMLDSDGPEDEAIVAAALAETDTTELADRSFATLSGGEKQRVLLARAIAQRPRVLLLDEPTNHLDVRHRLEILSFVKNQGVTVLAALHDLSLADRFADGVVMLNRGRVHAAGTPTETITDENVREVFGVVARRVEGVLAFDLEAP